MTKLLLLVLLTISSRPVLAEDTPVNQFFCHDTANKLEFDELLRKNRRDVGIIRLIAIRQGLCEMMENHQIPQKTGVDLWAAERQKILLERTKQQLNRFSKKGM